MRLSQEQSQAILEVVGKVLLHRPAEIFLYGSRVDDNLLGGDIDLVVICATTWSEDEQKKQFQVLADLKRHPKIGDRKINFSLISMDELKNDSFWQTIKNKISLGKLS